jgi:hypothetical protein
VCGNRGVRLDDASNGSVVVVGGVRGDGGGRIVRATVDGGVGGVRGACGAIMTGVAIGGASGFIHGCVRMVGDVLQGAARGMRLAGEGSLGDDGGVRGADGMRLTVVADGGAGGVHLDRIAVASGAGGVRDVGGAHGVGDDGASGARSAHTDNVVDHAIGGVGGIRLDVDVVAKGICGARCAGGAHASSDSIGGVRGDGVGVGAGGTRMDFSGR